MHLKSLGQKLIFKNYYIYLDLVHKNFVTKNKHYIISRRRTIVSTHLLRCFGGIWNFDSRKNGLKYKKKHFCKFSLEYPYAIFANIKNKPRKCFSLFKTVTKKSKKSCDRKVCDIVPLLSSLYFYQEPSNPCTLKL